MQGTMWTRITKLAATNQSKDLDQHVVANAVNFAQNLLSANSLLRNIQNSVKSEFCRILSPLKRKREASDDHHPTLPKEEDEEEDEVFPQGEKRRKLAQPSCQLSQPITELDRAPSAAQLRIVVFGRGENGELGLGHLQQGKLSPSVARQPRLNPFLDPYEAGVVQVAVGGKHCAALMHDGRVLTWGANDLQALGRRTAGYEVAELDDDSAWLDPLESTPGAVDGLFGLDSDIEQVAATESATFVLTKTGSVYGWGAFLGSDGLCGFLRDQPRKKKRRQVGNRFEAKVQATPIRIDGLRNIKEISAGRNHVLALTHSGRVYAWGSGYQAQLGRRLVQRHQHDSLIPRGLNLPRRGIEKVFAGFNHSFALDTQGRVWTWGLNNFGQTGIPIGRDDDYMHVGTPTVVESLAGYNIRQISGGLHHSLACTQDGRVLAWGRCDEGQLGIDVSAMPRAHLLSDSRGKARILLQPTVVPGFTAKFVAAGMDSSVAISPRGTVSTWGVSEDYRTGLGTQETIRTPTELVQKGMRNEGFTWAGCGGSFTIIARPCAP